MDQIHPLAHQSLDDGLSAQKSGTVDGLGKDIVGILPSQVPSRCFVCIILRRVILERDESFPPNGPIIVDRDRDESMTGFEVASAEGLDGFYDPILFFVVGDDVGAIMAELDVFPSVEVHVGINPCVIAGITIQPVPLGPAFPGFWFGLGPGVGFHDCLTVVCAPIASRCPKYPWFCRGVRANR